MRYLSLLLAILGCGVPALGGYAQDLPQTTFQASGTYNPYVDVGADEVMVYGTGPGFAERADAWRARGYRISAMTGISWGNYEDYYVLPDGSLKIGEIQTDRRGGVRMHGNSTTVGYNVPTRAYIEYMQRRIEPALEAGIEALFLEEPEFWAETGWSEGFRAAWEEHYGEPWQAPSSSVDAQWKASQLKYTLYKDALQAVFAHAKTVRPDLRCYVPTHSLINYAHWRIVSPFTSLAALPEVDGFIAQVWTGTSRTPNVYRGERKSRTLEAAIVEYAQMASMARALDRDVWFLHDPIEDNPNYDWDDYKENYECTVIASLLAGGFTGFEVMPWPHRIFQGQYPDAPGSDTRVGIPSAYGAQILAVRYALDEIATKYREPDPFEARIGVVVSDSLMYQRAQPHPSDRDLSHVYGLAMPLLKRGIMPAIVHLELPESWDELDVLVLSYEGQKPLREELQEALAEWVRQGGNLLYVGDGSDPYHAVDAWWNDNGATETRPDTDLFVRLELGPAAYARGQAVGEGYVRVVREHPASFAQRDDGALLLFDAMASLPLAPPSVRDPWNPGVFVAERGPYLIYAVLDEASQELPEPRKGPYLDLFSGAHSIVDEVDFTDPWGFYLDLDAARRALPNETGVVAASARVVEQRVELGRMWLALRGPKDIPCWVSVALPKAPRSVVGNDGKQLGVRWHNESRRLQLAPTHGEGDIQIEIALDQGEPEDSDEENRDETDDENLVK